MSILNIQQKGFNRNQTFLRRLQAHHWKPWLWPSGHPDQRMPWNRLTPASFYN